MKECPHCKSKNPDELEKCQWCGKGFHEPVQPPQAAIQVNTPQQSSINSPPAMSMTLPVKEYQAHLMPISKLIGISVIRTIKLYPKAVIINSVLLAFYGLRLLIMQVLDKTNFQQKLVTIIFILMEMFVNSWMFASMIYLASNWEKKKDIDEIIKFGMGAALPLLAIIYLSSIITFMGFLCFIIPGIYLMVYYTLAGVVFINEGVKGYSALKRSKYLIKGHGWSIALRILCILLVTALLLFLLKPLVISPSQKIEWYIIKDAFIVFAELSPAVYLSAIYKDLKGPEVAGVHA